MADVVDKADEHQAFMMQMQLDTISRKGREAHPKGECIWCESPFDSGSLKLFCNANCSRDWELHKQNRRI